MPRFAWVNSPLLRGGRPRAECSYGFPAPVFEADLGAADEHSPSASAASVSTCGAAERARARTGLRCGRPGRLTSPAARRARRRPCRRDRPEPGLRGRARARPSRPDLVGGWCWSPRGPPAREHHVRRHFESRLFALENGPIDVYAQFAFWMSSPWLTTTSPSSRPGGGAPARHMSRRSRVRRGTSVPTLRTSRANGCGHRLPVPCCPRGGRPDHAALVQRNRGRRSSRGASLVNIPHAGHLSWLERSDSADLELRRSSSTETSGAAPTPQR